MFAKMVQPQSLHTILNLQYSHFLRVHQKKIKHSALKKQEKKQNLTQFISLKKRQKKENASFSMYIF